jgi:hypothetical protein
MAYMNEWDTRRNKLIKVRESLPESLRDIPFRYVRDVAGLSADALRALDRAYRVEKVNIPRALQYLRETLVISVEDMIELARPDKRGPKPSESQAAIAQAPSSAGSSEFQINASEEDLEKLTTILKRCYPSMPAITAKAMARSDVMREALAVVTTTRLAISSDHAKSDFIMLTLLTLFSESQKHIHALIQ